jgi:hypothetical protein
MAIEALVQDLLAAQVEAGVPHPTARQGGSSSRVAGERPFLQRTALLLKRRARDMPHRAGGTTRHQVDVRNGRAGSVTKSAKDHGSSVKNDKQYDGLRKKG